MFRAPAEVCIIWLRAPHGCSAPCTMHQAHTVSQNAMAFNFNGLPVCRMVMATELVSPFSLHIVGLRTGQSAFHWVALSPSVSIRWYVCSVSIWCINKRAKHLSFRFVLRTVNRSLCYAHSFESRCCNWRHHWIAAAIAAVTAGWRCRSSCLLADFECEVGSRPLNENEIRRFIWDWDCMRGCGRCTDGLRLRRSSGFGLTLELLYFKWNSPTFQVATNYVYGLWICFTCRWCLWARTARTI